MDILQKIKLAILAVLLVLTVLMNGCEDRTENVTSKQPESPGAEPRVTVRLKIHPGRYTMNLNEEVTQNLQVKRQTQAVNYSRTFWFEVDASEPNICSQTTCKVSTKRIKCAGNQIGSFDTDDPKSLKRNKVAQYMSWQLKNDYNLTFGPNGKFISSSGLDEMWDNLASKEPGAALFVNQMKEAMGDDFAAEFLYGFTFLILPDDPVGVGAVWHKNIQRKMSIMGTANYNSENKLIKLEPTPEGQIAHIEHTGEITNSGIGSSHIGSVSMSIEKVNMKIEGEIQINIDTGLLVEEKMKMVRDMSTTARNSGGKNMPAKANFNMKTVRALSPVQGN